MSSKPEGEGQKELARWHSSIPPVQQKPRCATSPKPEGEGHEMVLTHLSFPPVAKKVARQALAFDRAWSLVQQQKQQSMRKMVVRHILAKPLLQTRAMGAPAVQLMGP